MANLDWFPIQTPIFPHRRQAAREPESRVQPFPIVVPDLLAGLTFSPVLAPPAPRPARSQDPRIEITAPLDLPAQVAPLAWAPRLAGPLPRPPQSRQDRAVVEVTAGASATQAAQLGWQPILADQPRPARSTRGPSATLVSVFVAPVVPPIVPCTDLVDAAWTVSALKVATLTAPDALSPAFAHTRLTGEDLC